MLLQSYPNLELSVNDDAFTDTSPAIVEVIVPVSSTRAAELTKLLENIQRRTEGPSETQRPLPA